MLQARACALSSMPLVHRLTASDAGFPADVERSKIVTQIFESCCSSLVLCRLCSNATHCQQLIARTTARGADQNFSARLRSPSISVGVVSCVRGVQPFVHCARCVAIIRFGGIAQLLFPTRSAPAPAICLRAPHFPVSLSSLRLDQLGSCIGHADFQYASLLLCVCVVDLPPGLFVACSQDPNGQDDHS